MFSIVVSEKRDQQRQGKCCKLTGDSAAGGLLLLFRQLAIPYSAGDGFVLSLLSRQGALCTDTSLSKHASDFESQVFDGLWIIGLVPGFDVLLLQSVGHLFEYFGPLQARESVPDALSYNKFSSSFDIPLDRRIHYRTYNLLHLASPLNFTKIVVGAGSDATS